jgi:hypothetical protein
MTERPGAAWATGVPSDDDGLGDEDGDEDDVGTESLR